MTERKKKTPSTFTFRLSAKERIQLEKEAAADRRTLGDYLRILIETHPDRIKSGK